MRLKSHTLPGSSLIIAVGMTSIVFIAVVGMTAAILQSLRSSVNISYSNTAFYAAEAGVEKALYAIVGHTTGFQFTSNAADPSPTDDQIDPNELISSSNNYLVELADSAGGPETGYVAYGRTEFLPSEDNVWLSIRDRSSATVGLSVDESASPEDPPDPAFAINLDTGNVSGETMTLYVDFFDGTPSDQSGKIPDYRITTWKGSKDDPCYFQEDATGPNPLNGAPANCPGWAYPGEVSPNDPDMGLVLSDYIFASMPCKELDPSEVKDIGTQYLWDCPDKWVANPTNVGPNTSPFLPLDEPWPFSGGTPPAGNISIIRDAAEAIDNGADEWSSSDTYLIDSLDPTDGGRGWLLNRAYVPATDEPPNPGEDYLPGPTIEIPSDTLINNTILTPLTPADAVYLDSTGLIERAGSLATTGGIYTNPREDDYLYIDACDTDNLDCPIPSAPNGSVSAPWFIEIAITDKARSRTYKSRVRGVTSEDCINAHPSIATAIAIDIDCLFPDGSGDRYENDPNNGIKDLHSFLSETTSPVEIKVSTNVLPIDIRLYIPTDANYTDFPLGGPDEKTTITAVGTSQRTHQILRTTIYQEETLPVFRSTTVF